MHEARPTADSSTRNHLLLPMVAGMVFLAMLFAGVMLG